MWPSVGCETRAWRESCVLPTETPVLRGQQPCTLLFLSCLLTGDPGKGGGRTLGTSVPAGPCPQGLKMSALQAAPHMGPSVPRPVPGLGPLGGTPSPGAGGPVAGGGQAGGPGLLEHPVPVRCPAGLGSGLPALRPAWQAPCWQEAWPRLSHGSLLLPWRPVPEPSRDKAPCAGRTLRSPSL